MMAASRVKMGTDRLAHTSFYVKIRPHRSAHGYFEAKAVSPFVHAAIWR